jgi:hypothetical protein
MIVNQIRRQIVLLAAIAATLVSVAALEASEPTTADAAVVGFCNAGVGGYEGCLGNVSFLYQTYGWGDQHSVCVAVQNYNNGTTRCSGGAGQGVYSGTVEQNYWYPVMKNNAPGSNQLHGVYLNGL